MMTSQLILNASYQQKKTVVDICVINWKLPWNWNEIRQNCQITKNSFSVSIEASLNLTTETIYIRSRSLDIFHNKRLRTCLNVMDDSSMLWIRYSITYDIETTTHYQWHIHTFMVYERKISFVDNLPKYSLCVQMIILFSHGNQLLISKQWMFFVQTNSI